MGTELQAQFNRLSVRISSTEEMSGQGEITVGMQADDDATYVGLAILYVAIWGIGLWSLQSAPLEGLICVVLAMKMFALLGNNYVDNKNGLRWAFYNFTTRMAEYAKMY